MKLAILCLDFDGVLHLYSSGWKGPETIPDPPVPGAIEFLVEAARHFEIHIFSSRSSWDSGISAMKSWLQYHGLPQEILELIVFPLQKPPAFLTIDDRALTFTGVWPSMESLKAFKPWNK